MGYIGRQPTNAILTSDDIAAGSVSKDKVNLISNGTAGLTVKGDNGSNDGYLQLNCRVNSHGIKLKSPPHSASQSYTLTFPSTSPVNGKVLQTDGSGNLSFGSAGTHVLIQSTNITSNVIEIDFDSTISDTYTNYMIVARGIKKDVSNGIRFQYKNGSSAITATEYDFAYGVGMRTRSGTTWSNRDSAVQYIQIAEGCGTQTASFTSFIDTTGRTSGAGYCPVYGLVSHWKDNSNGQIVTNHTGIYYGSTTIDGFKIFCQSGNFTSGRISLYGVSHA